MNTRRLKILHLVLYNPAPEYMRMYELTKPWYEFCHTHFGVQTFYYFYDSLVDTPTIDAKEMTLRLPGKESYYPGIMIKTLEAFEFFAREGYDVVVRSNISSPINFANLIPLIPAKPMLYGGPHRINPALVETQRDNPLFRKHAPMQFVHGTCIVLGPDTIRFLLHNRSRLCLTIEDDFAFGVLCKQHNVDVMQIGGQYAKLTPFTNIDIATCFRNHHVGSDRKQDVDAIACQVGLYFDRYRFLKTSPQVRTVCYHDMDVTEKIKTLCLTSSSSHEWTTDQQNILLDVLFGDPCPNVVKKLSIEFQYDTCIWQQRATLTFRVKDQNLFVC